MRQMLIIYGIIAVLVISIVFLYRGIMRNTIEVANEIAKSEYCSTGKNPVIRYNRYFLYDEEGKVIDLLSASEYIQRNIETDIFFKCKTDPKCYIKFNKNLECYDSKTP